MKPKLLLLVLVVATGIALTLVTVAIGQRQREQEVRAVHETENEKDRRMNLLKCAKLEKEKGKQQLSVPISAGDYICVENLEQARGIYTAVIAEPVQVTSVLDNNAESIGSWYKFKIIETLSEPAPKGYPFTATPPAESSPINENEFITYLLGGTLVIDGVTVRNYRIDAPPLTLFKKYLLFIEIDKASRVARLSLGPDGIFLIDADTQSLVPINKTSRYARELKTLYGNSAEKFRAAIKGESAPQ